MVFVNGEVDGRARRALGVVRSRRDDFGELLLILLCEEIFLNVRLLWWVCVCLSCGVGM